MSDAQSDDSRLGISIGSRIRGGCAWGCESGDASETCHGFHEACMSRPLWGEEGRKGQMNKTGDRVGWRVGRGVNVCVRAQCVCTYERRRAASLVAWTALLKLGGAERTRAATGGIGGGIAAGSVSTCSDRDLQRVRRGVCHMQRATCNADSSR